MRKLRRRRMLRREMGGCWRRLNVAGGGSGSLPGALARDNAQCPAWWRRPAMAIAQVRRRAPDGDR